MKARDLRMDPDPAATVGTSTCDSWTSIFLNEGLITYVVVSSYLGERDEVHAESLIEVTY